MRFKQYLTELFQQEKKDFKIDTATNHEFEASFEVGDKTWYFFGDFSYKYDGWGFGFEDEKGEFEITGLAKEEGIEVYAYVISILKYFIKRYSPKIIYFEGFESRQHKFYQTIIKRNKKELKKLGYETDLDQQTITIYKEKLI